jgi:probable rRNA maturation factor
MDTKSFSKSLIINHHYLLLPIPLQKIRRLSRRLYTSESLSPEKKISLVFCSDHSMKRLNGAYRQKNRATDVLSFSFDDPDLLGEIYISLQRAKVQARRYGLTYDQEVLRLFIHGFFHLLGFDHENEKDRRKMETKESLYFSGVL